MTAPAVLHLPHASTVIPGALRRGLLIDDAELNRELLALTDAYTDELFAVSATVATTVAFPVSRLIVDPERFADDGHEPMATRGMGAVYTRTSDGRPLRAEPLDPMTRETLMQRYYSPHHRTMEEATDAALAAHGHCLVVDGHSFASAPLPCDIDQSTGRPDICIGADPFHTDARLRELASRLVRDAGFTVAINTPFAGCLIPSHWYGRDAAVNGVMIEVNRRLYMDETSGIRNSEFATVARSVQTLTSALIEEWRRGV